MKKLLLLLVIVGILLVVGAIWLRHFTSAVSSEDRFTLASVKLGSLVETVSATGLLQPHTVAAVGSELSGKVVEIYPSAEVNKIVTEGEPLLKIDDRMAQIKLQQAKTAIRLAQADVQRAEAARGGAQLRVKKLSDQVKNEIGFQKELDEAEMGLKMADAAVRGAEAKVEEARDAERLAQYGLDLTVVRVPNGKEGAGTSLSGKKHYTIIERKVVRGQLIGPPASAQLFTLTSDLEQMQVHAQVSENDIGKIRNGLNATFTVFAYAEDEARFHGKIVEIRPMPTSLHGAVFYDVLIDVANARDPKTKEWMLRPGMTASVDIVLREHTDVWKMPTEALSFQLEEPYESEAARAKLAQWQGRSDYADWKPVWILDARGKPWPVFVRIGGRNAQGQTGIKDGQYNEVLEWDADLEPKPQAGITSTYPQVITNAPPVRKRGLFDQPNVKLF